MRSGVLVRDAPGSQGVNRFIAMEITDPPSAFMTLATAMRMPARRVARAADIAGAVEGGIASNRPNLIATPICVA